MRTVHDSPSVGRDSLRRDADKTLTAQQGRPMPEYTISQQTIENMQSIAPRLLFHGTRYLSHIMTDDELAPPRHHDGATHFTRNPNVALWYAERQRYDFDDGRGAIIVVDRDRLEPHYALNEGQPDAEVDRDETKWVAAPLRDLSTYVVGILRLEDLQPDLGVGPPRIPKCKPYVPVEPSTRQGLAREARSFMRRHPHNHPLKKALEAVLLEITDTSSIRWPFLTGDGTLA